MMRWVFAGLVLANIGLLMWASWFRAEPGGALAPRPVFHPELMVPITTPGVALKSRRNEKTEAPLIATKPRLRCVTVGPFLPDTAGAVATWMASERLEVSRRPEERRLENSFWVHLGPFENRKMAEARLKELAKMGIRDLLVMQDAQGEAAISLGLFSQADNARQRLDELAKKGIEAKLEIRYRNETVIWLDLRLPEPADEPVARLRGRDWGAGTVEVRDGVCPTESPVTPAQPVVPQAPSAPQTPATPPAPATTNTPG
jgi:hypothetical protein